MSDLTLGQCLLENLIYLAFIQRQQTGATKPLNALFSLLKSRNIHVFSGDHPYHAPNGDTLLHMAIQAADLQLIRTLLQLGFNPNVRTASGQRPLHRIIEIGDNVDLFRVLHKHGADPELLDQDKKTAIILAHDMERQAIVEYLKRSRYEYVGRPPLIFDIIDYIYDICIGDAKTLGSLLQYVHNFSKIDSTHQAVTFNSYNKKKLVTKLLSFTSQVIELRDIKLSKIITNMLVANVYNQLILEICAENLSMLALEKMVILSLKEGNVKILKTLLPFLKQGLPSTISIGSLMLSPLECAIYRGNLEMFNVMVDEENKDTPLYQPMHEDLIFTACFSASMVIFDEVLLRLKNDVNHQNAHGDTALHICLARYTNHLTSENECNLSLTKINRLLQYGACLSITNLKDQSCINEDIFESNKLKDLFDIFCSNNKAAIIRKQLQVILKDSNVPEITSAPPSFVPFVFAYAEHQYKKHIKATNAMLLLDLINERCHLRRCHQSEASQTTTQQKIDIYDVLIDVINTNLSRDKEGARKALYDALLQWQRDTHVNPLEILKAQRSTGSTKLFSKGIDPSSYRLVKKVLGKEYFQSLIKKLQHAKKRI